MTARKKKRSKRKGTWVDRGRLATGIAVAGLLLLHFGLARTSIRHKCCTYDEVAHLARGYSYWNHTDKRLISQQPPLVHAWLFLPLLNDDLDFSSLDSGIWHDSDAYRLGMEFLYKLGNDPDVIMQQARTMIILVSLALGVVVFLWARMLFGKAGGLVSLSLYALSPTILAHARLATTDIAISFFFLLSIGGIWRLLHRVSAGSLLVSTAAIVGLFLTKMSAVLVIPMGLTLMAVRLIGHEPLVVTLRSERRITPRRRMIPIFLAVIGVYVLAVWIAIWAVYGFRYQAMVDAQLGRDTFAAGESIPEGMTVWQYQGRDIPRVASGVDWMRRHKVLPEAYLYMILYTASATHKWDAFLDGRRSITGWWYFFPMCFLYKVPLPIMGVILVAVAAWMCSGKHTVNRLRHQGLYRTAPLWVLFVVYWAVALSSNLNIGERHLTPTFGPMFVLCGAAAGWLHASKKWLRPVLPVLLGLLLIVSLRIWPDYLAFFNTIAGGPSNGYRHLVDSSLDWGQDLPGLKRWLDQNPREGKVRLAYFGTANWSYYGIKALPLPHYLRSSGTGTYQLQPGVYCISATYLQQLYMLKTSHWTYGAEEIYQRYLPEMREFEESPNTKKARGDLLFDKDRNFKKHFDVFQKLKFGRLCALLRGRDPDDHIGHSILIYRVSRQDLEQALYGPPPYPVTPAPSF